jgi:hypothetical protein
MLIDGIEHQFARIRQIIDKRVRVEKSIAPYL